METHGNTKNNIIKTKALHFSILKLFFFFCSKDKKSLTKKNDDFI